jgi:hypothetical protein
MPSSPYIPDAPLYFDESRDARPNTIENYEKKLTIWKDEFRREAIETARLNEELSNIPKYIKALSGEYWNRNRPRYKSTFYSNRLDKSRVENLALLTDSRPMIDIQTDQGDLEEDSKIIHKLFEYEWLDKDMDVDLVRVADIARLMGTGFWKIGANYPGSLNIQAFGPDSVMPVQPGFDIQDSTGVFFKTWKPISWVKQKFPFEAFNIENEASVFDIRGNIQKYNRPDSIDEYVWNGLAPAMQRALSVQNNAPPEAQSSVFRTIELQEMYVDDQSINESKRRVLMRHPYWPLDAYNWWYWVEPGERLFPRKRLIVFAGRKRLYDGPAQYWHGQYPFAVLRLNPVPWSFWGLSQYRNLFPINMAMNEIVAGFMDMIKRALNPTAITKQGSIPPATWKEFFSDMPGAKVYMQGMAANVGQDLRYMEPPQIPAYVFNLLLQYLVPEFNTISNAMDISALSKKKQVPSGDTLDQMRDSLNTGLRLEERYMEVFLRDSGQQALSHIFQFFSTRQRMRILGAKGTSMSDFDDNPNSLVPHHAMPREEHWKKFRFKVVAGSIHGGAKDRDKLYALNLYSRHAISLQYLLEVLEIPNPMKIMQQIKEETQAGIMMQGKAVRPSGKKERNAQL